MKYDANQIKQQLHGRWSDVLSNMGIDEKYLRRNKPTSCPSCGGIDRYTFDDKDSELTYICRSCGAGDGIKLLMIAKGIGFYDALVAVGEYLSDGFIGESLHYQQNKTSNGNQTGKANTASAINYSSRLRALHNLKKYTSRTPTSNATDYYKSRGLSCVKQRRINNIQYGNIGCYIRGLLKDSDKKVLKFPAIIGFLSKFRESTVGASQIYIEPSDVIKHLPSGFAFNRKQFFMKTSEERGVSGCAVWFSDMKTRTLNVGEGIETMLSVARMQNTRSVAASCTANMLASLQIPPHVKKLIIWADKDKSKTGEKAAHKLADRYRYQCEIKIKVPPLEIPKDQKSVDWLDFYVSL